MAGDLLSRRIVGDFTEQLRLLDEKFPLVPHTNAGRLSSTVRRMKAEREFGIPVHLRTEFAISVANEKPANEIDDDAWERFYQGLCGELKAGYPEMYERMFGNKSH